MHQLLSSAAWAHVASELRTTPGGGAAVAALIDRVATEVARRRAVGCSSETAGLVHLSVAWQGVCWEKLHLGTWRDVPEVWREAYAAAGILAAALALESSTAVAQNCTAGGNGSRRAAAAAAMRHLDMASLMGGRTIKAAFIDPLIAELQAVWWPPPTAAALAGAEEPLLGATPGQQQQAQIAGEGAPPKLAMLKDEERALLPPWSLGPHGSPLNEVKLPSLEHFAAEFFGRSPAVLLGAMESWPALRRWQSAAYLRSIAGPRTVPVEVGKHYLAEGWGQKLMLFSEFLDEHLLTRTGVTSDADSAAPCQAETLKKDAAAPVHYLAQHALLEQVPALAADVHVPEYCALGEGVRAVNAWLGPGGTVTPTHTDPYHNLLCQVVGRKYVRLYPPEATPAMYQEG